jgi:hypothetical protein
MIQKIIAICLILIFLAACSQNIQPDLIVGSGVGVSEARSVEPFTQIELDGSPNVTISIGEMRSVIVGTDNNLLPLVETEVQDDKLVIGLQENTSYRSDLGIQVTIIVPTLEAVTVSGSGNVLIMDMSGDHLELDVNGSGTITAHGAVESLLATVSGSGKVLSSDLQAAAADATLDGSGDIMVYATDNLKVNLDGSGNVRYRGNPAQLDQSVNGSGSLAAMP